MQLNSAPCLADQESGSVPIHSSPEVPPWAQFPGLGPHSKELTITFFWEKMPSRFLRDFLGGPYG